MCWLVGCAGTIWALPAPFNGLLAAEPEGAAHAPAAESSSSTAAAGDAAPETVFYEGSGAPAELALSLLLGVFVITLPLTIASVGRR